MKFYLVVLALLCVLAVVSAKPKKKLSKKLQNEIDNEILGCYDMAKNCQKFKARGLCKDTVLHKMVYNNCQATCGLCKTDDLFGKKK